MLHLAGCRVMLANPPSIPPSLSYGNAMLLLLACLAGASDQPEQLTWQLTLNERAVGERTVSISKDSFGGVELRTVRSDTQVDASVLGIDLSMRQRMTANADIGPASFISVVEQGGVTAEVQGRKGFAGWVVSVASGGKSQSETLPGSAIDLSTADLIDPGTRVPLSRFSDAKLLIAETGVVVNGTVEPLGPSEVQVGSVTVPVEGYRWVPEEGPGKKHGYTGFYSSEGWLVRFETVLYGQRVSGLLTEAPPQGADDEPLLGLDDGLQAVEL